MDSRRAQEILHSSERIDVELNGQSVWIESVDTQNEMVHVQVGGNPDNRITVAADQLREVE